MLCDAMAARGIPTPGERGSPARQAELLTDQEAK